MEVLPHPGVQISFQSSGCGEMSIASHTTWKAIIVGWITCFLVGACVSDKATSDDPPLIPDVRVDAIHSAE